MTWRGWVPPGGEVGAGETPRAAASRELREETWAGRNLPAHAAAGPAGVLLPRPWYAHAPAVTWRMPSITVASRSPGGPRPHARTLLARHEPQRDGVDAVAVVGRGRVALPVEDVPEV
ncbi:NUDIX domain-containing protein [Sphaerisporangium sp. NPDC049002]|uniref:NUDIX domain-containing protein n=1 Tax=unclassified Sphaerisporangium TaxID=2630420 RepID=UPI0033F7BD08